MLSPAILTAAIVNGLLTGAVYALVALGLTLIYGVLHIINFAHGALLTAAMFAAFFAYDLLGIDPYLAILVLAPAFFALGYALQRFIIGPASHGDDRNMLLVTLGLAVIIENALLFFFRGDTRTIDLPYAFDSFNLGFTFLPLPRAVGFLRDVRRGFGIVAAHGRYRYRPRHPRRCQGKTRRGTRRHRCRLIFTR